MEYLIWLSTIQDLLSIVLLDWWCISLNMSTSSDNSCTIKSSYNSRLLFRNCISNFTEERLISQKFDIGTYNSWWILNHSHILWLNTSLLSCRFSSYCLIYLQRELDIYNLFSRDHFILFPSYIFCVPSARVYDRKSPP